VELGGLETRLETWIGEGKGLNSSNSGLLFFFNSSFPNWLLNQFLALKLTLYSWKLGKKAENPEIILPFLCVRPSFITKAIPLELRGVNS